MSEVGRPTKLTPETVKKLEEAFAMDCTVEEACFYADISRQTYYAWIKENPKLSDRFDALRQRPVLEARTTVIRSLKNPDYAFRYLERKKKDEFSPRTELTGAEGAPIPILASFNVHPNNGNQENSPTQIAHSGSTGGNLGEQDSLDTPLVDTDGSVGPDPNADQRSIGVNTSPEAGSDEGLSHNPEDSQLLSGSQMEQE